MFLRRLLAFGVFALSVFAFPATPFAAVIFDNVAVEGINTSSPNNFGGSDKVTDPDRQVADDFVLGAGNWQVTDIRWWGLYTDFVNPAANFTVYFYADDGGVPTGGPGDPSGTAIATRVATTTGVDTGSNFGPFDILEFSANIAPVDLVGGVTYWLAIQLDDTQREFLWAVDQGGTGNAVRGGTDPFWDPFRACSDPTNGNRCNAAFQLTGEQIVSDMPEASTFGLLGLGLVGFGFAAYRRKTH